MINSCVWVCGDSYRWSFCRGSTPPRPIRLHWTRNIAFRSLASTFLLDTRVQELSIFTLLLTWKINVASMLKTAFPFHSKPASWKGTAVAHSRHSRHSRGNRRNPAAATASAAAPSASPAAGQPPQPHAPSSEFCRWYRCNISGSFPLQKMMRFPAWRTDPFNPPLGQVRQMGKYGVSGGLWGSNVWTGMRKLYPLVGGQCFVSFHKVANHIVI